MTSRNNPRSSLSGRQHLEAARQRDAARHESEAAAASSQGAPNWSSVVAKQQSNGKVKATIHMLAERRAFLRRAEYETGRSMSELVDQALALLEAELNLPG